MPWRKPSPAFVASQGSKVTFRALFSLSFWSLLFFIVSCEDIPASWDSKVFDQAYGVIVSEIMLQQTQCAPLLEASSSCFMINLHRVATVINYFNKWMKEFPTFEALAAAPLEVRSRLFQFNHAFDRAHL